MTLANHQLIHSSESEEWYTPWQYVEAARSVLRTIALDPASCAGANEVVKADKYFGLDNGKDGLFEPWLAPTVFLNPPYGRNSTKTWLDKAIYEWDNDHFASGIVLLNNNTDSSWFKELWRFPLCFTDHRIKFWRDGGKPKSPTHGNVFVLLWSCTEDVINFDRLFEPFGHVNMPREGDWRVKSSQANPEV